MDIRNGAYEKVQKSNGEYTFVNVEKLENEDKFLEKLKDKIIETVNREKEKYSLEKKLKEQNMIL